MSEVNGDSWSLMSQKWACRIRGMVEYAIMFKYLFLTFNFLARMFLKGKIKNIWKIHEKLKTFL